VIVMPLLPPNERRKILLRTPEMFSRLIVAGIPVEDMLNKKALIVGAGGLGVIVADILARSGIGALYIVDRDIVTEANFNRLGFSRDDIRKPKAEALAQKIEKLRNSETVPKKYRIHVEAFHEDIIGWPKLEKIISKVDIVFSCLDNEEARRELNFLIMKLKKPMVDGATSIDGLSGTVISIVPCKTPCYECYYGSETSVKVNHVERIGYCDASIATTMAIVASIQADQGLKILLNYGKVLPMIRVNLRDNVSVLGIENVKPRKNCPIHRRFC